MHHWTRWTFPTLNITLFFCFLIPMSFLFLTNRTCVRNGLRDFSITLYFSVLPLAKGWGIMFQCFYASKDLLNSWHITEPWKLSGHRYFETLEARFLKRNGIASYFPVSVLHVDKRNQTQCPVFQMGVCLGAIMSLRYRIFFNNDKFNLNWKKYI
jgi:hypothetical protein